MGSDKSITGGFSGAAILPLTTDGSGQITGAGTPRIFDFVTAHGPVWPASEAAASTEFIEKKAATGATFQWPKNTKVYDGVTGTLKPGGGGSGSAEKLKFTIAEFGKTLAGLLPLLRGQLVLCVIPIGDNVTSSEEGYYYLLGKVSSGVEYEAKPDEVVEVPIEVTGSSATADAAGDTALTWAPGAITPVDGDPFTPTALVSGDLTALKAGTIVVK